MLLQLAAQSHLIWELNNQPMAKRGKTFHNWPLRKREGNRSRNVFWDRCWRRVGLCVSAIGDFGCLLFAQKKKKKGKRPRKPETSIKYNFEEMENEFPFGTFQPEKQEYLFRRSVTLRKFLLKQPEKACSIYFPTGFSVNFL